jgi:7,8-dihydropterin-6-yl-methyl-4-(beta-D-ribofuranosyl)aminobenzene 5'-phosphate synthase
MMMHVPRILVSSRLVTALAVIGMLSAQVALARDAPAGTQTHDTADVAAASRITVLYDAFGRDPGLTKDWGFAALIEVRGKRILFDTGNNADVFAHNVEAKGIDLRKLDFVVMSHRHGDHIGGLNYLLKVNPDVRIYAPKENFGVFGASFPGNFYRPNENLPPDMRYFGGKPPATLVFGTPWPQGKFTWVANTTEVAPGFRLIVLKGSWGVDLDVMEVSLAIDTPEGTVLVVGCGHPTIERIVAATREATDRPIHLIIGGLHLLPAQDDEIRRIAADLRDRWQVAWIAPAHCTGEAAFAILQEAFGPHYLYAGLGTTLTLGPHPIATLGDRRLAAVFDTADRQAYRRGAGVDVDAPELVLVGVGPAWRSPAHDLVR